MALKISCDSCGGMAPTHIVGGMAALPPLWVQVTMAWRDDQGGDKIEKILCKICAQDINLGNLSPKFS